MATIKSFTSLEQSKKLAVFLPLESADMVIWGKDLDAIAATDAQKFMKGLKDRKMNYIPCWSLAALLEQLPYEVCDDDGNSFYLQIYKEDDYYQIAYTDPYEDFERIETDRYEHFVDACYELIIRLHKLNLL